MRPALFHLLCAFALLGSVDIGYFHIHRFTLYRVASSRAEHMTHLLRAVLFLAALSWVMFVEAEGMFSLVLPAILLADLVNSLLDVALEPRSRLSLGSLAAGRVLCAHAHHVRQRGHHGRGAAGRS